MIGLVLLAALHWGTLTAWIIHSQQFTDLRMAFIIMLPAFVFGGSSILSISR